MIGFFRAPKRDVPVLSFERDGNVKRTPFGIVEAQPARASFRRRNLAQFPIDVNAVRIDRERRHAGLTLVIRQRFIFERAMLDGLGRIRAPIQFSIRH